jgi:hypothetical protein
MAVSSREFTDMDMRTYNIIARGYFAESLTAVKRAWQDLEICYGHFLPYLSEQINFTIILPCDTAV